MMPVSKVETEVTIDSSGQFLAKRKLLEISAYFLKYRLIY